MSNGNMYDPNTPGPYQPRDRRPFGAVPPETFRRVPPPPKRPGWAGKVLIAIGVGLILIAGSCTAIVFDGASKAGHVSTSPAISQPAPSVTAPSIEATTAPAPQPSKPVEQAPSLLPTDGTLLVGKDVKPGTYQTRMPAEAFQCYWARLKDLDDSLDSIIANDLTTTAGARVTLKIKATDYAVEINCEGAIWKRIG